MLAWSKLGSEDGELWLELVEADFDGTVSAYTVKRRSRFAVDASESVVRYEVADSDIVVYGTEQAPFPATFELWITADGTDEKSMLEQKTYLVTTARR